MPQSPLLKILLFLLFFLLFGTLGFYFVESDYSLFDSFYMSVITLSTVGYSEVGLLSYQGRIFTVIFILIGFLGITLAFRFLGEQVAQNWSVQKLKLKKTRL
jgi:voltage-gated potassium channel